MIPEKATSKVDIEWPAVGYKKAYLRHLEIRSKGTGEGGCLSHAKMSFCAGFFNFVEQTKLILSLCFSTNMVGYLNNFKLNFPQLTVLIFKTSFVYCSSGSGQNFKIEILHTTFALLLTIRTDH